MKVKVKAIWIPQPPRPCGPLRGYSGLLFSKIDRIRLTQRDGGADENLFRPWRVAAERELGVV
ncbi:MAG: hypothetical protein CMH50_00325 [Myxococcales bacterium]|nr:hypothetical protein [Myxococcales bacterium]